MLAPWGEEAAATRETLFGRRFWTLAGIALALLVLTGATGRVGLLRLPSAWLNQGVAPVELAVTDGVRLVQNLWANVADLWSLRQQDALLQAQVMQLQAEVSDDSELRAENQNLTGLLHLQQSAAAGGYGQGIAAQVIGRSADGWWDAFVVHKGAAAGVRAGMVAVTPQGDVVGQVEAGVGPTSARVMLITNPDFGVGIEVERPSSRAAGVAVGQIGSQVLTVTFFSSDADVQVGDVLVTSGLNSPGAPDGFPPGLTVATVTAVAPGSFGLMRQAVVRPAADLEALDAVLLLPAGAGGA